MRMVGVEVEMSDLFDEPAPRPKRKHGHPEHNTQIQCKVFCQQNILCPYEFLGFDRGPARTMMQHEYERRRGIRRGQSDTLVKAKGFVGLWIEVKDVGKKPTDDQREFGAAMVAVGDVWDWGDSVMMYAEALNRHGIPLRATWRVNAEHLDRLLAGAKARKAGKKPRSYRPRKAPVTAAGLRFAHAHAALGRPK